MGNSGVSVVEREGLFCKIDILRCLCLKININLVIIWVFVKNLQHIVGCGSKSVLSPLGA